MKVWFVVMQFPVVSEAFAVTEIRALRAAGATVEVFALRNAAEGALQRLEPLRLRDVPVSWYSARSVGAALRFSLAHPLQTLATLLWLLSHAWKQPLLLAKCLALLPRMFEIFARARREPPQVLHLFWGHYPSVLAFMGSRWLPGTVVSMSLGAYDLVYRFGPAIDAARRAQVLWTHAEVNRQMARDCGIDAAALRVLPRGVDWADVPDPLSARGRTVVTVARLVKEKNTASVLRACALARQRFTDLRLVVIGDGAELRELQSLAVELRMQDAVTFTGALDHSAIWPQLAAASVFTLLSVSPAERLPNAVKEAMACGCICVVSRTPGIEELVAPSAGIVDAFDVQAAAERICAVFAEPERFEGERRQNRAIIAARFDAAEVARTRLTVWREAAARLPHGGLRRGHA